ncbi:MAG: hypothetical protein M1834_008511 [Cirrosporium novae-zelandiae]|nr:MAG: hypothetical protein M1834_008511 [Cirrosporium novae-zelandiae]
MTVLASCTPGSRHWTDPISREETYSMLEKFKQKGWLPPTYKESTIKGIKVVEKYWQKHCNHLQVDDIEYLMKEEATVYMNFLDWIARTSKRKGKETLDMYWRRLCEYYSLFAHRRMHEDVRVQYINQGLRAEHHVSVRKRRKDILSSEDLGILLHQLWVYGKPIPNGRHLIQITLIMLFSAFTGTRPGVLLPSTEPTPRTSLNSRMPDFIRLDQLPHTICYRDIELFVIRNPSGGRDIVAALIDFRNLKGSEQGADGTKFLMHQDYQLVYCPIMFLLSLAHADHAFQNRRMTPEVILRLKVPKRLHSLPIPWKDEMRNVPLLRHIDKTPYGIDVHPIQPMKYNTSNSAIKQLGVDAGYEYPIHHYNFRRWVANEANRAFTDQERNRILGQSGTKIFEKHYQDHFISRDVQSVVLLRPTQDSLYRAVAQMNRNRDPLAPKGLSEEQRKAITQKPYLAQLHKEKQKLFKEMRSMRNFVRNATDTDQYRRHAEIDKEIKKVRNAYHREEEAKAKKDYYQTMPVIEIDKQIDQMLELASNEDVSDYEDDPWKPPVPQYLFPEQAQIEDAFFGSQAESMTGNQDLMQRIKTIQNLVRFCQLREPCSRVKKFDWTNIDENASNETPNPDTLEVPMDRCIFCYSEKSLGGLHPPKKQRIDSLRRHLVNLHLQPLSHEDCAPCPCSCCKQLEPFENVVALLNHIAIVHKYDLHLRVRRLPPFLTKVLVQDRPTIQGKKVL